MAPLTKILIGFGLGVATFCTSASADTYRHIDELALNIERQSKRLVSEVRHYRHTPEYRHLIEDARDMADLADHLHDVAHDHGSLAHMESDLRQLDSKFHHLESLFDRVEYGAAYGRGHVHGETSHVRELLHLIEDDIHHLQDDLRSLRTPVCTTSPVVVNRPPIYPSPYSNRWGGYNNPPQSSGFGQSYRNGWGGRGITIGGGSSRFTIGF